MQFTERAKLMLGQGIAEGMPDDANPFIKDKSSLYLRFDGLDIEHAKDNFGGVNVCFRWRGHVCYIVRVEGPGMEGGHTLHLSGFEGRIYVDIG